MVKMESDFLSCVMRTGRSTTGDKGTGVTGAALSGAAVSGLVAASASTFFFRLVRFGFSVAGAEAGDTASAVCAVVSLDISLLSTCVILVTIFFALGI